MPSRNPTHVPSTDWADDFTLKSTAEKISLFEWDNKVHSRQCLLNAWATFHSGAERLSHGGPVPPLPPMVLQMLNEASTAVWWSIHIDESTGCAAVDAKTGRTISHVCIKTPYSTECFERPLTELQQPNWWRSFEVSQDPDPAWLASLGLRMRRLRSRRGPNWNNPSNPVPVAPLASQSYLNAKTLMELDLSSAHIDGRIDGLERLPMLRKLNLRCCLGVTSVTCLAASRSLVKLHLSHTSVTSEGIEGLERIPTLRKLYLHGCEAVTSVACLGASTSLAVLDLSASGIVSEGLAGLERIPTLTELFLNQCPGVTSVTCLCASGSLAVLGLSAASVTSEGVEGLERIPTLRKLDLRLCRGVTSVTCLGASRSLVELDLTQTSITSEGIEGLERIPTLTKLNLRSCSDIMSVSCLAESTSLVELRLDATSVTSEGLWCLGRIPTLAQLDLDQCKWIKRRPSVATLRKKAAAELQSPARRHRAE